MSGRIGTCEKIYTLPAGVPFLKSLARSLLDGRLYTPEELGDLRILLPTRRACRSLQSAFLDVRQGAAMLLPRLQALGDVDEEELSLSFAGFNGALDLPPEMPPLRRQMLLARLIKARPDFEQGFDRALGLAKALGQLMDQIYTENLSLDNLAGLVPDEFADHWQVTIEFLEILSAAWPAILADEGMIDGADRRNRLILALAEYWQGQPPDMPVIVAGTTGSIPATGILLRSVLSMPKGRVILPGLDQGMDQESWSVLDEPHPQYGLKHLLGQLDIERGDVQVWPHDETAGVISKRHVLAREIMRPAATSGRWAGFRDDEQVCDTLEGAFEDLSLVVCDSEHEEAQVVSILLRQILEDPYSTACLVTPDRGLAARVSSVCRRWGIEIDDSAGKSFVRTSLGAFIILVLKVCQGRLAPMDLLSLVQHPFVSAGMERAEYLDGRAALDMALRGAKPAAGFDGMAQFIQAHERIADDVRGRALSFLEVLEQRISPLLVLCYSASHVSFSTLLNMHLRVCEDLADLPDMKGAMRLWSGAEGQTASLFFSGLLQQSSLMSDVNLQEYGGALELFMRGVTVRPAYGTHSRVRILGQLEARMIDADLVILGGLNEGVWPPDAGVDPWMSRPMRKQFGLPGLERSIGLAAHDFVQGLCAGRVVLTRSKRLGQAPSVPSRWLQRMNAVVQAAGLKGRDVLGRTDVLQWARGFDVADEFVPMLRPDPAPPVDVRPRRLSVTKIEMWLQDPYSIYAGYILRLRPLEQVEKEADAAVWGSLLHDAMDRFVTAYPDSVPDDAAGILQGLAREIVDEYSDDVAAWRFMWPRFEKISYWYEGQERAWRSQARPVKTEVKGEMSFDVAGGAFVLSARADRIDKMLDGRAAIIDYKSGGNFSKTRMKRGDLPQLPLEGLILAAGGFEGVPPLDTGAFGYWLMTGAQEAGKTFWVDEDVSQTMEVVERGLRDLIERFDEAGTPYLSLPRADYLPRFNDYLHLARVAEWATMDDAEEEAA